MTPHPKRRPSFVPEAIWDQCRETMCICYEHQWWGLACWCPDCRPRSAPVPLMHAADPYAQEST